MDMLSQTPGKLCLAELMIIFIFYSIAEIIKILKDKDLFYTETKQNNKKNDNNLENDNIESEASTVKKINLKENLDFHLYMHIIAVGVYLASYNSHFVGTIFCYFHLVAFFAYIFLAIKQIEVYKYLPFVLGLFNFIIFIIGLNQKRILINY